MSTNLSAALVGLALLVGHPAEGRAEQQADTPNLLPPGQQLYAVPAGYMALAYGGQEMLPAEAPVQFDAPGYGCDYGQCDCGQCDCCPPSGGCASCCQQCCGSPRWRFFGESLYIRPGQAEVVYAMPYDPATTPSGGVPVQMGAAGVVDFDYRPAFRAGFARALSDCSSLGVTYSYLDIETSNAIAAGSPYAVRSMVSHPSLIDPATDGQNANATYAIDYDLVDCDFRRVFSCSRLHTLSWLGGARYGNLNQRFLSQHAIQRGMETIRSNIQFDGGGIRVGLEGERYARCSGWMVYGRGTASFVAGRFLARYDQRNATGELVVNTGWKGGRIVTMLDLELGAGWTSPNGLWRFSAGYMISAWFNTVTTPGFIQAVQQNSFAALDDTLTFEGLAARAELRF